MAPQNPNPQEANDNPQLNPGAGSVINPTADLSIQPLNTPSASAPSSGAAPAVPASVYPQPIETRPEAAVPPAPQIDIPAASAPTSPVSDQQPTFSSQPESFVTPPNAAAPGASTPGLYSPAPAFMSASAMQEQAQSQKRWYEPGKKVLITVGVLLLLGGGSAGAYFGYYIPNKPPNVWRTALTRTQQGYDKLSQYVTAPNKNVNGEGVNGSFKMSGLLDADGTFSGKSDGKNGELTGSVSATGVKIDYDIRAINSGNGNTPDIYFKVDGLQDLGSLVGGFVGDPTESAQISKALNGLNNQWYFVDHTLFDQFAQGSNNSLQFSSADVKQLLDAVGNADKQYIFTNNTSNMAIVVKQYVGKEKQDGLNVYHYKVGVDKDNLEQYGKTLCGNLVNTKFFKDIEGSATPDTDLIQQCQDSLALSKVDTSQTADAWVDLHTKLIHRIRFTDKNNKSNYTDIFQNYQGGNVFPFGLYSHSVSDGDTTNGTLNMKLDMKSNTFSMDGNLTDSSSKTNASFKLDVAPNSQPVKVSAPPNSKTIIQLMNDLGLGGLVSSASSLSSDSGGSQVQARDTKRETDINAQQSQLEAYYSDNGGYPIFSGQMNSNTWLSANFKGVDTNAFSAPGSSTNSEVNSTTPAINQYGYMAYNADGKTVCTKAPCIHYKLFWHSEADGTVHEKDSLN